MISREGSPYTWLLRILLCFLASAVSTAVLLPGFSLLRLLLAALAWYAAYRLLLITIIEYEYLLTNGLLDVDKIVARRKRRRLISVSLPTVAAFGRYHPAAHSHRAYHARILACKHRRSSDLWYCIVPAEHGQTLIVFHANQALLEAIKHYLPQEILHEASRLQ